MSRELEKLIRARALIAAVNRLQALGFDADALNGRDWVELVAAIIERAKSRDPLGDRTTPTAELLDEAANFLINVSTFTPSGDRALVINL